MTYVNVRYGLRGYSHDYEIRDELWRKLSDYVHTNKYYTRHDKDTLMFIRDKYFHDFIEKEATTTSELYMMRGIRKLSNNDNIIFTRLYSMNTFHRTCIRVNEDSAIFIRRNGKGTYQAILSDKVNGKIRVGDECVIKVLPNRIWIVTDIVRTDDLETQLIKFKDLGGNY